MEKPIGQPTGEARWLNHHDLDYPWNSAAIPHALAVEAATRQWILERGLLDPSEFARRYDPLNIGALACLTYPGATFDKLVTVACFLGWIFIQDDHYDNSVVSLSIQRLHRKVQTYIDIMNGAPAPPQANRAMTTLAEIVERISGSTTPSWMRRFATSMRDFWVDGLLQETQFRTSGIVADVNAYMKMRLYSVGVLPVINLVEFAHDFQLPSYVIDDTTIQQLWRVTASIIIYTNDIFSYEKERTVHDPNNLIHVLRYHLGISVTEAVDRIVRMHDAELSTFERLSASLPDWGPETNALVARYVDGHRAWMKGSLDWQLLSRRYATGRRYLDAMRGR